MTNWKENNYTFKNFTEGITNQWVNCGFDKKNSGKWIENGLSVHDFNFAQWLKDVKKVSADWFGENGDEEELRKEYQGHLKKSDPEIENKDWKGIHPNFTLELQKEWEDEGFNYEQTKEWIVCGLSVYDADFANYLSEQGYTVEKCLNYGNIEKLRKEYNAVIFKLVEKLLENRGKDEAYSGRKYLKSSAQRWLDAKYLRNQRQDIKKLDLSNLNLEGDLDLRDFINLEEINIIGNPNLGKIRENSQWLISIFCENIHQWWERNYPQKEAVSEIDLTGLEHITQVGELIITDFPNLREINNRCDKKISKITKVIIRNCPRLKNVNINELESNKVLICDNLPNLALLNCANNQLTALKITSCLRLTSLVCSNNNFSKQDLSIFSHLTNLKKLLIGNSEDKFRKHNHFYGSLEPLKNLTNLEELDIDNTDLESGLEYLPEGLKVLKCFSHSRPQSKAKKFDEELSLYGWRIKAWQEAHPELMGEKKINNLYKNKPLKVTTTIPSDWFNWLNENKVEKEDNGLEIIDYQRFAIRDKRPFSWEIKNIKLLSVEKETLPFRLYNVKKGAEEIDEINIKELKKHVEETRELANIRSYATLSYVWGKIENEDELTSSGRNSLTKAIKTCQHLGIDYLWIDQLCINQQDREEKAEEVRKMRKCYGESEVTLISINSKISVKNKRNKEEFIKEVLKIVINSEWFSRSWTFQEGLLSKQTIFMFDDELVDGRLLAQIWVLLHQNESYFYKLNDNPQIFATPVGWTYYGNENHWKNQVSLGLLQALGSVKNRSRSNPADGIYSILGLLTYGEKIKVSYKPKMCLQCPNQEETNYCSHPKENKCHPIYTEEDLEKKLIEVVDLAMKEGYLEPLAWNGPRRSEFDKWRIPKIDEKGSVRVWGELNIRHESKDIEFAENGVRLMGSQHTINKEPRDSVYSRDEKTGKLMVFTDAVDDDNLFANGFVLRGTKETLEKIKPGDTIVIPNQEEWKIENDVKLNNNEWWEGIAILVPSSDNSDCPIDTLWLLLLLNKWKTPRKIEKLFIDLVNKKVTNKLKELTKEVQEEVEKILSIQEELTMFSFIAKDKDNISTTLGNFLIDTEFVKEKTKSLEEKLKKLKKKVCEYLSADEIESFCKERKDLVTRRLKQQAIRSKQENEYQASILTNPKQ